ncbi:MAG: hypothetical protein H8E72_08485 [Candidatus Marinimicrobia bacterium]|nr:hypothetical protein [Candidatus Neomarinimicrobiota bacterium]
MKVHLRLLSLLILLQSTFATTIYIPEDYSTIQEGIDNSVNSDTVLVSEGTYYENLIIQNKDIAILASSDSTTLDGSGNGPVVSYFDVGESALLQGFTIRNGTGHPSSFSGFLFGGGVYCESSAPHLNQLNISGNTAFSGGGVAYYSTSPTDLTPLITNCIIENNLASEGGGVFFANFDVTIEDSEIMYNGMDPFGSGGGIQMFLASLTMKNVNLSYNGTKFGGGIYCASGNLYMEDVQITHNNTDSHGGGVWLGNDSHVDFNGVLIANNFADGNGGGMFIHETYDHNFDHLTISQNSANQGGAIYGNDMSANFNNSILYSNSPNEIDNEDAGELYNISYANIQGGWEGEGNIDTDPLFTDPENGDFTLQPNSPCIDAGDPNSPLDPDGTITDMGAFYYDQSQNCTYTGDLNNDESTNILDIVLLVNIIIGDVTPSESELCVADLNQDGELNILDIVLIVNQIMGNE